MLIPGTAQHLGNRTLMLILYRRTTVAFVMFIVSAIGVLIIPSLSMGIAGMTALGGAVDTQTVETLSSILSTIDIVLFLGSIIIFLIGLIIGMIQFQNHTFTLEEFGLKMQEGIINKTEVSIPYRQIQDINLMRSWLHRLFGVSRLIMITAGNEEAGTHEEADTIFDPIDADLAEELRTYLGQKIGVQIVQQVSELKHE